MEPIRKGDTNAPEVLILIIMEDTHGALALFVSNHGPASLNPYYNGRYSWSKHFE